jgi:hypothetical protein
MRVGELVALEIDNWCEADRAFLVKGKGSRQRLAFLPDDRSLKAVQTYLSARNSLTLSHPGILVKATGARISTQGIARMLIQTTKSAGITSKVTQHVIRHTVATLLLRYGAEIRVVPEACWITQETLTPSFSATSLALINCRTGGISSGKCAKTLPASRLRGANPIDLLRVLVGVTNVATSPDWRQSARRLVDILVTGFAADQIVPSAVR